nr:immunoglobulin heavy chain junction region [Macaca mulatta]MOW23266.1 immunoglobulin heavy chain junction region [Macaca mulatta]MOW23489.1 immunoglobulin heavy chain junction region [Macaca mulatta]MOW23670.1 immunoglobulin heavy chain junction region [Macaca mulatta]MOW23778.1 immunoglobulin heavy chain junction region [Macaca mulatta]
CAKASSSAVYWHFDIW